MNQGQTKRHFAVGDTVSLWPAAGEPWAGGERLSAFPQLAQSDGISQAHEWLGSWSGLDGRARMVVTGDRIYVVGERRAEQALAGRQDLRVVAGRLEATDPTATSDLDSLLDVKNDEVRTLFLPRRLHDGHLVMRAGPLGGQEGTRLIGVTFWIADERSVVEWPDFGPIFGLTAAEAKVVEQLIQGISAEGIAAALSVSINTVRTHICHVYEKLGITCREQLWRRLAPYRLN